MANWIVDTGNTKRGFYFSHIQDIFKNGFIYRDENDSLIAELTSSDNFMGYHSSVDPRNVIIFDETNPETGEVVTMVGLKRLDQVAAIPLKLDMVKQFLDSSDAEVSPIVALQYQFASADASVTTKQAIENAIYVTKIGAADGTARAINIADGSTVWETPNKTHVVNYLLFGKVAGVANTYFILLNSFRTELYNELQESNGHKFHYIDQSTGGMKNFFIRPVLTGATLLDNDIIVADSDTFSLSLFNGSFLSDAGLTINDISFAVSSSISYTDNGNGQLSFDLTGKDHAYVSIKVGSNIVLDQEPKISIRRSFNIYKG